MKKLLSPTLCFLAGLIVGILVVLLQPRPVVPDTAWDGPIWVYDLEAPDRHAYRVDPFRVVVRDEVTVASEPSSGGRVRLHFPALGVSVYGTRDDKPSNDVD